MEISKLNLYTNNKHSRISIIVIWFLTVFKFYTFPLINSEEFNENELNASRSLSRQKRYLIFPRGSNVQLVYCLTIGAYGREGDLVLGMTAALAWELPNKVEQKFKKILHRKSRSIIFPKIEAFLQSTGLNGKSCVMKALCEAGQRSELEIGKGTFIQELLHAIFTLPNDGTAFESIENKLYDYAYKTKQDCTTLYPNCQYSINNILF
ncbi:uncharacterized protein LOC122498823 isoform X1 [Leptopilina heterotoma]|uniref:uncharacterized protein LOC122498823 isoform X1 n=1 Tax=Leptopilina heterotoma TaxID=63436 RepID=UPI001CA8B528|nr:uncharacterized protein LOC122498823 isoform X1 [Leptopilina heterotoma]